MPQKNLVSKQIGLIWKFLGFFQSPFLRVIHMVLVALIFLQIASTFFMEPIFSVYHESGEEIPLSNIYHYISGTLILLLTTIMTYKCIATKGLKHYFPYLYFDFSTLIKDFSSISKKVPSPAPKGITSCIQGIGLIMFMVAALTGLAWFILYMLECDELIEPFVMMEYHYAVAVPIYLYIAIHGILSALHFIIWQRKVNSK